MSRAATIPADADLLCEGCGYVLTGLPPDGRCPECGKLLVESASILRQPPPWERPGPLLPRLLRTTIDCIFRPTQFFRTLSLRPATPAAPGASRGFAYFHYGLASLLLGTAAWAHFHWYSALTGPAALSRHWPSLLALLPATCLFLLFLTRIAARLTTWEAAYRGIRLRLPVVSRGLDYHAAHYLPVALLTAGTVLGYQIALVRSPATAGLYGLPYLYALCGEVVIAAFYLFKTYWIAMRNLMYGNR